MWKTSLNRKLPLKPEVGQILKNCVGTFDCFDPRNPFAQFQRNRFVKSTQLGNFAAEIGVRAMIDFWILRSRNFFVSNKPTIKTNEPCLCCNVHICGLFWNKTQEIVLWTHFDYFYQFSGFLTKKVPAGASGCLKYFFLGPKSTSHSIKSLFGD